MAKNTATNYDAGHRWKSHADFYLICLPYNCKLYLFKHVHMHRQAFLCMCVYRLLWALSLAYTKLASSQRTSPVVYMFSMLLLLL